MDKQTKTMRLKKHEVVLRIHKFKEHDDIHQHAYSEMLLFFPWREESNDLCLHSEDACLKLYRSELVQHTININKQHIYPYQEHINLDQLHNTDDVPRPSHIFDQLNPEGEQQNEDDMDTDQDTNAENFFLPPSDEMLSQATTKATVELKSIAPQMKTKTIAEISNSIQMHSEDQHVIFAKIMTFTKDVIKHINGKCKRPTPPLLLIHGSAGNFIFRFSDIIQLLLFPCKIV
jgi:hypothetical protein